MVQRDGSFAEMDVRTMESQLQKSACVLDQLEKLRAYPPNWDGYGAKAFATEIIEAVRTFLDRLPDDLWMGPHAETNGLLPAVVPMSSGSIQLEWHFGNRILELEFETPTSVHYLKWWPQEGIQEEGVYPVADCRQSSRLIEWVLHGYDPE